MLRPQRNGSKMKGYMRSNSYSVSSKHAKDYVKPTKDKIDSISYADELPVETLKKPLNNFISTDMDKTKNGDNWAKPLISISLQNPSEFKNKRSNSEILDIAQDQNYPSNISSDDMHKTWKNNDYTYEAPPNIKINLDRQIKPASKAEVNKSQPIQINNFMRHLDDGNSIISAYLKNNYGHVPKIQKISVKIEQKPKTKAENKLKSMINSGQRKEISEPKKTQKQISEAIIDDDVPQNIEEQISQDYANQQFQSIKQSINNSGSKSGSFIKQSIKAENSIRESIKSIKQSFPKSKFSGSIPESINIKDKPIQSRHIIQQSIQAYEDDFEASQSKYQSPLPRKINSEESMSKSFRKKKSPAIGNIRLGEETNSRRFKEYDQPIKTYAVQNKQFDRYKSQVKQLMNKTKRVADTWQKKQTDVYSSDKINTLYNKFKFQLGRFMQNGKLQQKVKKLVSFLPTKSINQQSTSNTILNKILEAINELKSTSIDQNVMKKMQQDYNNKLQVMMKNQQRILKLDLQRRLNERDDQIKKLIEGIQQVQQQKPSGRQKILEVLKKGRNITDYSAHQISGAQKFDYKSYKLQDYSEQYSQVSWQSSIDLWDNISENQKRQIYQKNSQNVVNYLTKMMMEEIKLQAINRSFDISFEFPSQFLNSKEMYQQKMPAKINSLSQSNIVTEVQNRSESKSNGNVLPLEKTSTQMPKSQQWQPKKQQQESYQINEPVLIQNKVCVQKARKAVSKYQRKIKAKGVKILKTAHEFLKKPQMNALRLVQQMKILESSEVDNQDKQYEKGFQQHILIQLVSFLNNNTLPYKKLEILFKQRLDHILKIAKQEYLSSLELAIVGKKKDLTLPTNFKQAFEKYSYERMAGQEPFRQNLCEHQDRQKQEIIKKKIEEQLLNLLIEESVRQIGMRRK